MDVNNVKIEPLGCKHYETRVSLTVEGRSFTISISGNGKQPSERELENGWEPDFGMDHVESKEHLFLAQSIKKALTHCNDACST